jgi:hypothetical protein
MSKDGPVISGWVPSPAPRTKPPGRARPQQPKPPMTITAAASASSSSTSTTSTVGSRAGRPPRRHRGAALRAEPPIDRLLGLPDAGIRVLLQRTDDEKVSKEPMHLDLETDDIEAESNAWRRWRDPL